MDFLVDNILLVAVALVSGTMLIWPTIRRGSGGAWVNTLEATQLINRSDAIMLDVREAAEYADGHVIGSQHIPLAQLAERAEKLSKKKEKPVIAYCASGNRSASAVAILKKQGYTNVYNLSGGFASWRQAGLPVEK